MGGRVGGVYDELKHPSVADRLQHVHHLWGAVIKVVSVVVCSWRGGANSPGVCLCCVIACPCQLQGLVFLDQQEVSVRVGGGVSSKQTPDSRAHRARSR
jgi:hypothetical protein